MNNTDNIEKLLHSLKDGVSPSESFRTNARIRIINTVTSPHPLRPGWYQRPRVWGYTFGSAIATVVLSVGTVFAAQSSLPDNTLYPVKILSERVALTLSPTESIKTTVAQTIISRRVTEVEETKQHGDKQAVRESISHFNEDVKAIQKRKDVSQEKIEREVSKHEDIISEAQEAADEETEEDTPDITPTGIRLPQVEGATSTRNEED